jgi:tryptophan-rich sensory protein
MDRETWALTFGITALVFVELDVPTPATRIQYNKRQEGKHLIGVPPGYLFGIVWTVLNFLISANLVLYANDQRYAHAHNDNYQAAFVIALINLFFKKTWVFVYNIQFPRADSSLVGLTIYTFLVFASALVLLIVEALENRHLWWLFILPYVLWTFYATFLMWQFSCATDDNDDTDNEN